MAHVAFVCQPQDRLAPATRSSVAIVIASLAGEVARAGHRVSIIAADAAAAAGDPAVARAELIEVDPGRRIVARFDQFISGYFASRSAFSASDRSYSRYRSGIVRALATLRPDVVHLATYAQYLPALARALPGARLVLHFHDELWGHLPPDFAGPRLAHAAQVLCVNTHIAATVLRRHPFLQGRVSVLHNGVDPAVFTTGTPEHPSARRLLYVGRLSPEKGLHVLGAAMARVYERFPDVTVDLVGSPGLMPYDWLRWVARDDAPCRSLVAFYGSGPIGAVRAQLLDRGRSYVQKSIAVAGAARGAFRVQPFVPHANLRAIYRSATAVVCPSVCNEIPLSVYEGMAGGLPVVLSADAPQDGPVTHGETALVVPRANPDRLAEALLALLANPGRCSALGQSARARVLGEHTWNRAGQRLLTTYERLLAGPA